MVYFQLLDRLHHQHWRASTCPLYLLFQVAISLNNLLRNLFHRLIDAWSGLLHGFHIQATSGNFIPFYGKDRHTPPVERCLIFERAGPFAFDPHPVAIECQIQKLHSKIRNLLEHRRPILFHMFPSLKSPVGMSRGIALVICGHTGDETGQIMLVHAFSKRWITSMVFSGKSELILVFSLFMGEMYDGGLRSGRKPTHTFPTKQKLRMKPTIHPA